MKVDQLCSSRDARAYAFGALQLDRCSRTHVVLNSLSLTPSQFRLLALGQWMFQEIGKRAVWAHTKHYTLENMTQYNAIAIDADMMSMPKWMQNVLMLVAKRTEVGVVEGLPLRSFHLETKFELAFRTLQSGLNTGKIVLHLLARNLSASGSQLVTGGTCGLGLLTGRWLTQRGARTLVLASRSGAIQRPGQMMEHETAVEYRALQQSRVATLFAILQRSHISRGCVCHPGFVSRVCGTQQESCPWIDTKIKRLRSELRVRSESTWRRSVAHQLPPMRHWVFFSSVAGLLASPTIKVSKSCA